MITARDYLFQNLNNLVLDFPNIMCKYEYHAESDAHYVEINPEVLFKSFTPVREAMVDLMEDFYALFPGESIVFVTEGDVVSVEHPELILIGEKYNNSWSCWLSELSDSNSPENNIEEDRNYCLAA